MDKVAITLQARLLIASAESKIDKYKNEVIIKEYREHVAVIKANVEATIRNRGEKARLLHLIDLACPVCFPAACKRDSVYLRQHLALMRFKIPSLV